MNESIWQKTTDMIADARERFSPQSTLSHYLEKLSKNEVYRQVLTVFHDEQDTKVIVLAKPVNGKHLVFVEERGRFCSVSVTSMYEADFPTMLQHQYGTSPLKRDNPYYFFHSTLIENPEEISSTDFLVHMFGELTKRKQWHPAEGSEDDDLVKVWMMLRDYPKQPAEKNPQLLLPTFTVPDVSRIFGAGGGRRKRR